MKMPLIVLSLLTGCGSAKTPNSAGVTPATETAKPNASASVEPSKAAIGHYCAQMAAMTPASLENVPPAKVQAVMADRMAEAAKVEKVSDWSLFENWLRETAPSDRQSALEVLILKYGLQDKCRAVAG